MLNTLKHRYFTLLWLNTLIGGIGQLLYTVGVMVTIFEQTGSALQTVGAMVATTLPTFLLGPFAGAIVDRFPRQRVLLITDLWRMSLLLLLMALSTTAGFDVMTAYLIVAGIAIATTFHQPARQALIPALVPRPQIVKANSLILTTVQATYAFGYLVGGVLAFWLSFESFILLNALCFLVAAVLTLFIRPVYERRGVSVQRVAWWQAIGDGVAYLREHKLARPLVIMEVLEYIPHGVWTSGLMLVFVKEALGGTVADWGNQNALYFTAIIIGAGAAGYFSNWLERNAGRLIVFNAFANGFLTLIYALSPTFGLATLVAIAYGPPQAWRDVAQDSLLQTSVEEEMLGRVFALRNMGFNLTFMLSGLFFAWLADYVPIRSIFVAGSLLYLATAVYAAANRPLRQARILAAPQE
ncbi:MAG: MFS transporter [Anaerolineales bacterium]|nr:MFS transporter [Anaerolineales bacterium]